MPSLKNDPRCHLHIQISIFIGETNYVHLHKIIPNNKNAS